MKTQTVGGLNLMNKRFNTQYNKPEDGSYWILVYDPKTKSEWYQVYPLLKNAVADARRARFWISLEVITVSNAVRRAR